MSVLVVQAVDEHRRVGHRARNRFDGLAEGAVRPLHNRIPLILPPDTCNLRLDSEPQDRQQLTHLLKPYPAEGWQALPISREGRFRDVAAARLAVFRYTELFHNRQRLHSSLFYVSPATFACEVAA